MNEEKMYCHILNDLHLSLNERLSFFGLRFSDTLKRKRNHHDAVSHHSGYWYVSLISL